MQFCFRCLVFSDFSDSQYSVFKVQSGFSSVSKISSSKWVRQPPILPYRLQYSTFGRYGLHRRVRDGNGCYPIPYRHRKYLVVWLFNNVRAGNFTHTLGALLCLALSFVVRSFVQETSPYSNRLAPQLASLAAWRPVAFLISVFLFLNPCMQACRLSKQKSCCTHFNNWTVMQTLLIPLERR